MVITIWRRQPIYVVHRTPAMLGLLGNHDDRLKDAVSADSDQPAYCKNPIRSRNAEYLVLIGVCTHLGCLPKQRFDAGDPQLAQPGRRLGLSLPWLAFRYGRARVQRFAGVGQPAHSALFLPTPAQLLIGEDGAAGAAA